MRSALDKFMKKKVDVLSPDQIKLRKLLKHEKTITYNDLESEMSSWLPNSFAVLKLKFIKMKDKEELYLIFDIDESRKIQIHLDYDLTIVSNERNKGNRFKSLIGKKLVGIGDMIEVYDPAEKAICGLISFGKYEELSNYFFKNFPVSVKYMGGNGDEDLEVLEEGFLFKRLCQKYHNNIKNFYVDAKNGFNIVTSFKVKNQEIRLYLSQFCSYGLKIKVIDLASDKECFEFSAADVGYDNVELIVSDLLLNKKTPKIIGIHLSKFLSRSKVSIKVVDKDLIEITANYKDSKSPRGEVVYSIGLKTKEIICSNTKHKMIPDEIKFLKEALNQMLIA